VHNIELRKPYSSSNVTNISKLGGGGLDEEMHLAWEVRKMLTKWQ
jgi:hypothetical protein